MKYEEKQRSPTTTSPASRASSISRNSAVSPVSFPLYGPMAISRARPVQSASRIANRAIGKPTPRFCVRDCGKAAWLAGVSGIETVVPSMR